MAFEGADFENELEIDTWVKSNIKDFLGDGVFLNGFLITTRRNKGGIPDGFFLDLDRSQWIIIECELIRHGVWEHIAEQIIRFIVAARSDETQRIVRDRFFEELERTNGIETASARLNVPPHRLMATIESIIESTPPLIAVFIDEVNEDLKDMAEALNTPVKIFRVHKYLFDGKAYYLAPDKKKTAFETGAEYGGESMANPLPAINMLGGGRVVDRAGALSIFELTSGERVVAKYSKKYRDDIFWYGITPNNWREYKAKGVSHIIFIMGSESFVKVPMTTMTDYLDDASVTLKEDGTVQKWHVRIKSSPEPILCQTRNGLEWELKEVFFLTNESSSNDQV